MTMSKAVLIYAKEHTTYVIREDGTVNTVHTKPVRLLEEACLVNGSSLSGRTESFRHLLGIRQKPAVLISEVSGEIWFPTLSMTQQDCVWIRYDAILEAAAAGQHACVIRFFSGISHELDLDVRVIREQMKRCRRFLELLHQNIHSEDVI